MDITRTPAAPWSCDDERFFRLVSGVFPADFLLGAGLLLSTYDAGGEPALGSTVATVPAARARLAV